MKDEGGRSFFSSTRCAELPHGTHEDQAGKVVVV